MEAWKSELSKERLNEEYLENLNHYEYKLNLHIYYLENKKVRDEEDKRILERYKKNLELVKHTLVSKENIQVR